MEPEELRTKNVVAKLQPEVHARVALDAAKFGMKVPDLVSDTLTNWLDEEERFLEWKRDVAIEAYKRELGS